MERLPLSRCPDCIRSMTYFNPPTLISRGGNVIPEQQRGGTLRGKRSACGIAIDAIFVLKMSHPRLFVIRSSVAESSMPTGVQPPQAQERLPAPSAVVATTTFAPARAAAAPAAAPPTRYRILRTTEVDEYEAPVPAAAILAPGAPRPAPPDDTFRGTARKVAKLSIVAAATEPFE